MTVYSFKQKHVDIQQLRLDKMQEVFYSLLSKQNIRIAFLSDYHNGSWKPIIESLCKYRPGIICIAGDFVLAVRKKIDISRGTVINAQKPIIELFEKCVSIAPTFTSIGNHEWMLCKDDIEEISNTGVTILDNNWAKHNDLIIGGLSSVFYTNYKKYRAEHGNTRYPDFYEFKQPLGTAPDVEWLYDFEKQDGFRILLSHHPEYWEPFIRDRNIDLVLAGHTHGGQIRLFGRGLYVTGQGWFPKYTKGIYENRMIVSAGLSNTARIPRLFNPKEVVYVELKNSLEE